SKSKKTTQEEKQKRLLEFFHEKKNVFVLKELEKIASKEKGIPAQTIKDVLNSLVDDDLVDTDKIGTSTYFWSFPGKTYQKKLAECRKLEQSIIVLQEQSKKLDDELSTFISHTNNDDDNNKQVDENKLRAEIQENLMKLEQEKQQLQKELVRFQNYDPANVEQLENECQIARTAIERWTDNIFQLRTWSKNRFQIDSSDVDKGFGIPNNFDYYNDDE
ncbi:Meiotic nuclear division protein 1, partial [Dermatophagoides farinae]